MKTLKDFLNSVVVEETIPETIVENQEVEVLQVEDGVNMVFEDTQDHHNPMDPPAVLIMRRKSIRQFPNGQRVALYYVDKINKYVTVPYQAMQWSTSMPEETIIDKLESISESSKAGYIEYKDGKVKITVQEAESILEMYSKLNEQNKKMVLDLSENIQGLNKVINFARSNRK